MAKDKQWVIRNLETSFKSLGEELRKKCALDGTVQTIYGHVFTKLRELVNESE